LCFRDGYSIGHVLLVNIAGGDLVSDQGKVIKTKEHHLANCELVLQRPKSSIVVDKSLQKELGDNLFGDNHLEKLLAIEQLNSVFLTPLKKSYKFLYRN
jgi:hypothetical protein